MTVRALYVGCTGEEQEALGASALANVVVVEVAAGAPLAQFVDVDIAVVGARVDDPLRVGSLLAQQVRGLALLLIVPPGAVAKLQRELVATPHVPMATRVVAGDDVAALAATCSAMVDRVRVSRRHKHHLDAANAALGAVTPSSRHRAAKPDLPAPHVTVDELNGMRLFYEVYDADRRAISDEIGEAARAIPELRPFLDNMTPEQRDARDQATAELQRAALFDGAWHGYLADLRQTGALYAGLGLPFAAWFDILSAFRSSLFLRLAAVYGEDPAELAPAVLGMDRWVDIAMATIGEAYVADSFRNLRAQGERERWLALLVEAAADAIVSMTPTGLVTSWNQAAERLYGYSAEEAIGAGADLFVAPDALNEHARAVDAVRAGDGPDTYQTRFVRRDGTTLDLSVTLSAVTDADDDIVGVVLSARDISQLMAAERGLRTANALLERRVEERTAALRSSNQDLERFAFIASHDLQEPLRMVASFTELLADEYGSELDAQAHEYIDFAVNGARRMQAMLQDLLTYSRVGSGSGRIENVALDDALDDALDSLRLAVQESALVLDRDPLPAVRADRAQIARVFQNLLANSIKFAGQGPPRVHVSGAVQGEKVQVSVRDGGIGFPMEHADRVFEIFHRLSRDEPGSGLGLAICRRVLHGNGGRIWAESEPGSGSTFHFVLPRART